MIIYHIGGTPMPSLELVAPRLRTLLLFLLGGLIVVCCAATRADSGRRRGDPEVIIAGGSGSFPVGSFFSFVSPSGTSPIKLTGGSPCVVGVVSVADCIFGNATNSTWTSLTFKIGPSGQTGPFLCSALAYFTKCLFNSDGTQVTFSGGPGINPGKDFLVEVVGWQPNSQFNGQLQKSAQLVLRRQPPPRSGLRAKFDAAPEGLMVGAFLIGPGMVLAGWRFLLRRSPQELGYR